MHGPDRWATFDCYGTLIDWRGGIGGAIGRLWPDADVGALVDEREAVEALVERDGTLPYDVVLERSLRALAVMHDLPLADGDARVLSETLPRWPPFREVPAALAELRARGWRIAVLSNTDPPLLHASLEQLGVPVDLTVAASAIGSYKPAPVHWAEFRRRAQPGAHVHVAASLFHDIEPCAALGIPAVWINREAETSSLPRAAELPDLVRLPDVLDELAAS